LDRELQKLNGNSDFFLLSKLFTALNEHAIVAVTDAGGKITNVNDKFLEISGYSRQELLGENHRILNSGRHSPEFFKILWSTISSGSIWRGEIQNKTKNGQLYWVETTITPVLDTHGNILEYIALRTDVTARKRAESELQKSKKQDAIVRVAMGISHNLNSLLTIVLGNFEMLTRRNISTEKIHRLALSGISATKRISNIVRHFGDYSGDRIYRKDYYPIHKLIANNINKNPLLKAPNIQVDTDYAEDLIEILLAKPELENCLNQLILNAIEATDAAKKLTFSTKNLTQTKEKTLSNVSLSPGRYVMLEITDNGKGIPVEIAEKIFDPFFTTKEIWANLGLGLTMIQNFTLRHGGDVSFESNQRDMTIFRIYISADDNRNLSGFLTNDDEHVANKTALSENLNR